MNAEEQRLKQTRTGKADWYKWGPYLSERQWGTVREDYSSDGNAWDYFPHAGDWVNNTGQVTSNGQTYSAPESDWAAVCFTPKRAQIVEGPCSAETMQAVAGNEVLIRAGKPATRSQEPDKPYPRSAVAIDATGQNYG